MPGWRRRRRQEQEREQPDHEKKASSAPQQVDNSRRQDQLDQSKASDSAQGGFLKLLGGLTDRFTVPPTEDEQASLQAVHALLGSEKLGGSDGAFNHGDLDAIVDALKQDRAGLSQEIQQHLLDSGKPLQARLAGRALSGGRGPLKRMIRQRIDREATPMIRAQLEQGLTAGGVSPESGERADDMPRTLTFEELRAFEQHAAVLQQMQTRVEEKMGFGVGFPGGLSQDAVEHTLSGRLGLPPGGQIQRKQSPQ